MLRTVVKLLLMVPLLLPQGVCVCAWAAPAPEAPPSAPSAPTSHCSRCSCHQHSRTALPVESRVAAGTTADWPVESDQHAPACPASKVEWKALITVSPNSLVSQTLCVTLPELILTCSEETLACQLDAPVPAARPLYLSLLNLRI